MGIVDRIQKLANEAGISIAALERATGLSNGIIKKWQTQSPSCDKIITLANYLNTTTEYILLGKENELHCSDDVKSLLKFYNQLAPMEKGMVIGKAETLAELAAERAAEQAKKEEETAQSSADERPTPQKPLPFPTEPKQNEEDNCYIDICSFPANAGTGVYIEDSGIKPLQIVHTDIADRANYAIRVSGDSMMPEYCDGDIVLVETCRSVAIGEIGVFMVDGDAYIKKYGGDRLISFNPKYKDMLLKKYETSFCRGRVLGIAEVVE